MENKIIIGIIIVLLIVAGGFYFLGNAGKNQQQPPLQITIYCNSNNCAPQQIMGGAGTLIQGCYRNLLDCQTSQWLTYANRDTGVEFKYPATFGANVWNSISWPPKATVAPIEQDPTTIGCANIQADLGAKQQAVTINNVNYNLYTASDAGAGSVYNDYCYITQKGQSYYILDFNIRYHTGCYEGGCGAYCGTSNETECRNFNLSQDVEAVIQQIVSTLVITK
ncbi:MAG: hypothetical protein WC470_01735 [Candidatus Paceibacterota bacterium]